MLVHNPTTPPACPLYVRVEQSFGEGVGGDDDDDEMMVGGEKKRRERSNDVPCPPRRRHSTPLRTTCSVPVVVLGFAYGRGGRNVRKEEGKKGKVAFRGPWGLWHAW